MLIVLWEDEYNFTQKKPPEGFTKLEEFLGIWNRSICPFTPNQDRIYRPYSSAG